MQTHDLLLTYICEQNDATDYYISLLPEGVLSIAAFCEAAGLDVVAANYCGKGIKGALQDIETMRPAVVGLSVFSHNRHVSINLARAIKKKLPTTKIVLGGVHATFLAEEIIARYPFIDYIIRGEGEHALSELCLAIRSGENPQGRIIDGTRIVDLNSIPPGWKFSGLMKGIDVNEQFKYIITSRGCPHHCTYCCSPAFWGRKTTMRSAQSIVDSIEHLYHNFGIIYFSIRDDNFTLNRNRVLEFCLEIRKRKIFPMWNCQSRVDTIDFEMLVEMKKSGLEHIQFGVESGSPRILQKYDKSIDGQKVIAATHAARRAGVYVSIYLMNGMHDETPEDVSKTIQLVRKALPGDGMVSPVAWYPGTELYMRDKKKHLVDDNDWFDSHEPGLFLRQDRQAAEGFYRILQELEAIREKSWYREKDFRQHRENDQGAWVRDILETDYLIEHERYADARRIAGHLTARMPENPWGWLRLGRICFEEGDFLNAALHYRQVSDIVPRYYGGWLKAAQSMLAAGDKSAAKDFAREAISRNQFDLRIRELQKMLHL